MINKIPIVCPYKGIAPYSEDDAAFFFGRDDEIRIIMSNLVAYRLTLVYGPSGVGKSLFLTSELRAAR